VAGECGTKSDTVGQVRSSIRGMNRVAAKATAPIGDGNEEHGVDGVGVGRGDGVVDGGGQPGQQRRGDAAAGEAGRPP
jgi:hypothetical protein